MNRSERLRRTSETNDIDEEEVRGRGSRGKVLVALGLVVGIMMVAGAYILTGESLGMSVSSFPPLTEAPQIGRVVKAEGPKQLMSQGPRVGETPPDFSFVDPDGVTRKLSDYKGRAVLINFWATWCPACVKEMPDIEAVYREEKDNGLIVLGISLDDDVDVARKFLQQRGVTFPSIMESNNTAITLYRIQPIPASFFIDRLGIVRSIQVGAMTKGMIRQNADKIL